MNEEDEDEDAEDAGDVQEDDDVQQDNDTVQDDADQNDAVDEDEDENDDDQVQKDEDGYKVQRGFQVRAAPTQQDMTPQFLENKLIAVKLAIFENEVQIDYWYRGIIDKVTANRLFVKYNDGQRLRETLNASNYGPDKKWVILEKLGN